MKTLILSDIHADSTAPENVDAACRFVREKSQDLDVTRLLSTGDLLSFALESDVETMIANPQCQQMRDALRMAQARRGASFIRLVDGNHDPYHLLLSGEVAVLDFWWGYGDYPSPGARWDIWTNLGHVRVEHGHRPEFDPTTNLWSIVTKFLKHVLGVKRAIKFMAWATGLIFNRKSITPAMVKAYDKEVYNILIRLLHDNHWRWLTLQPDYYGMVCGHTHAPHERRGQGKVYVNCGDFSTDRTYVEVDADTGSVILKEWK